MFNKEAVPLALYIHVPWCIRKCPYCDFNSHQSEDGDIPQQEYLEALFRDLEQLLPRVWGRRVSSVFIGGGTPSLLSAETVYQLISGIRARLPMVSNTEITMEANPGSLEVQKFGQFYDAGITRLSLGVQSFSDQQLKRLGRIHDSEQAHRAISAVSDCEFDSYNIDLMFGLPGQSVDELICELETALNYRPPHLSLYQLTIEPNTPFSHATPADLPGDDELAEMQEVVASHAQAAGLDRYEVSAYATAGKQCRHNLNYWQFGDYLGIGAGAHSKLTEPEGVRRFSRPRQPSRYMHSSGTDEAYVAQRKLDRDDLVLEFMINALRLSSGFSYQQFELTTGLGSEVLAEGVASAVNKGLLVVQGDSVQATDRGFRFLSEIQLLFT